MKDKLTVKDICKKYKTRDGYIDVLENLNFTLSKGESLSIVGESGAGKSTLLNILALLLKPDSGEIIFEGTNILELKDKSKFRLENIGYISQELLLIDEKTVYDNLKLPLIYKKNRPSKKEMDMLIEKSLDSIGMSGFKNKICENLSGGEKQRIILCRSLINNPKIVLADEPTGALDFLNKEMIMDFLLDYTKDDKYLIVTTHDDYLKERCIRNLNIEKIHD